MKLYISLLCIGLLSAGVAKGEDRIVRDCLKESYDETKLMFDDEIMWVQSLQKSVNPKLSPLTLKALSELKGFFDQYDTKLVMALVPRPLLGYPRNSEYLKKLNEDLALEASYDSIINQIEEIGISAPDLTKIYDYFSAAWLQRSLDHHLTSTGAWAVGAAIAYDLKNSQADPALLDEFMDRIADLDTRETKYTPSQVVRDAFSEACLDDLGAIAETDLFVPIKSQSEETLFGDQPKMSPDVVLAGTSYSQILDGAIGRSIAHFSNLELKNLAVTAGGDLTSIELALTFFSSEVQDAAAIVWELPHPSLSLSRVLPVLMIAKAIEQPACTQESTLYQQGDILLDDTGVGRIPLVGVLENRLELSFPHSPEIKFRISLGTSTEKKQNLDFRRNMSLWRGEALDYHRDFSMWLPGYEWFEGEAENDFFLEIEVQKPEDVPKSITYRSCFLLPGE